MFKNKKLILIIKQNLLLSSANCEKMKKMKRDSSESVWVNTRWEKVNGKDER